MIFIDYTALNLTVAKINMLRPLLSLTRLARNRFQWRKLARYTAVALLFSYGLQQSFHTNIWCIEDKTTIETRKAFDYEIRKLQQEFGQMAIYPEVRINTRGNTYIVEFELDPRKCDTLAVLASFLACFQDANDFRLISNNTVKQDTVLTMQIDFE
jgi:hypothetical protein